MNVIRNNNITVFDVDDTLAIWPKDFRINKPGRVKFCYGGENVYLEEHSFHTLFLKQCFLRGDHVIVWSANGYEWAHQVVEEFALQGYVSLVMTKPVRHVDDKEDKTSIVGPRVFVPHETYKK